MNQKFISIMIGGLFCAVSANAQSANLLEGLIPSEEVVASNPEILNKSSYFYEKWKCFNEKGDLVISGDHLLPESYYTRLLDGPSKRVVCAGNHNINLTGSGQGFEEGQIIALLSIPYYDSDEPYCYAIPINVPKEGDYTLSGLVKPVVRTENEQIVDRDLTFALQVAVVFVVEGNLTNKISCKNFKVEDGTIKVTDDANKAYKSVFSLIRPADGIDFAPFSGTVHLTPDDKYISVYGPFSDLAMANLKLTPKGVNGIDNAIFDEEGRIEYYDMNGIRVSESNDNLTPGIYIRKQGSKAEKILRH